MKYRIVPQVERIAQTDPEELEELRWPPSSSMVKPVTKVKEALKASLLCAPSLFQVGLL